MLARAATWRAISPRQLLALVFDQARRFIETAEQLSAVIVESLDRLYGRLHGTLPAVKDLWSSAGKNFKPKDEQDLSDYIARHLNEDLRNRGVIVNREVQIRRGIGAGSGQSTDIHVDAAIPGSQEASCDRACVIIEVKGNWNKELGVAMQTQLRDRYLKNNNCKNGIYLVGWFLCSKWTRDYHARKCPRISIAQADEQFAQQAIDLSTNGYQIKSYILDLSLK